MAQTPTIVSAFDRLRNGKTPVPDDPSLSLAGNFLYTLTGKRPDDLMDHTLDVALTLHADHELNASTFAARVVAATLSDIYSSITAAIGALKGPLHRRQRGRHQTAAEAGTPDRAAQMVHDALAQGKKIPGFGHRVYRTEDPRATHLRVFSEDLCARTSHTTLYQGLPTTDQLSCIANQNAATAVAPNNTTEHRYLFTPVFAVSRMSGPPVLETVSAGRSVRARNTRETRMECPIDPKR
jgi:citrate synthase